MEAMHKIIVKYQKVSFGHAEALSSTRQSCSCTEEYCSDTEKCLSQNYTDLRVLVLLSSGPPEYYVARGSTLLKQSEETTERVYDPWTA